MSYTIGKPNRLMILGAVQGALLCPVTGKVLDVRSAVLLETAQGSFISVLAPEGWEARKEAFAAEKRIDVVATSLRKIT